VNANGHIVQLTREPPFMHMGVPHWHLAQELRVRVREDGWNMVSGVFVSKGSIGIITEVPDRMLRPIRDPGPDAVDWVVAKLGPAPMTLTEIREWSEVTHG
jgi:hypothetical protein